MLDRNAEDYVEPVVELGIALALIIFAICRLGLLGIFFFETVSSHSFRGKGIPISTFGMLPGCLANSWKKILFTG